MINQTNGPTIIHWHGQLPPWKQDGVPWPETPPIVAGGERRYGYKPISGTYWMHSHEGLLLQELMAAPLIVHAAETAGADR